MTKLAGRSAIITGANRGFGLAIARAFVQEGAHVLLCARDGEMLDQVGAELARQAPDQRVLTQVCDVSDPLSVKSLIEKGIAAFGQVQILVNNAGVYGTKGAVDQVDLAEWFAALAINLNGVVLTTAGILPHFRQHGYGKIINISGGGATNPMPFLSAYAASKAAVVRFTESIALEVQEAGIDINAVAPGALATRLLDEVIEAGAEKIGAAFYQRMLKIKAEGGTPMEKGTDLCVFLASAQSDGITGKLISALWDAWATFSDHVDELKQSDVYTLRRIVPKDRGLTWGDV